ncbi:ABC transporter permease [Actinokineospora sp. PR83]|uniref:FtsX-like permease family protein n=1 Tax=Actinokineospora sp. PR83 TaxID=2884908 RepID=UPI001F477F00|nr:FtsX-like permease family protein [Actinokineospora sp. PR83]MCG8914215.1 ABC transporter permease [Actinokineospora sp. PR83]
MVRTWCNDLAIGVRLAVGGGRTSLARFLLSTFGVATAVAVLLLAASVQPTLQARDDRTTAANPDPTEVAGITPLALRDSSTEFRGRNITVRFVHAPDATSPVPPGMDAVPAEGSMWVSRDLATLLAEPGSGLLRDRFPPHVAGVLGQEGVTDPHDLIAYVGAGPDLVGSSLATPVYAFGTHERSRYLDPTLLLLILLGIVALLVPVFIFLAASTRIAGAERDRRLSALRLVGAGDRQVRRIAAAESLVSAVAGLVVGVGLYQVGRSVAPGVVLAGISAYPSDIVPVWWLAALVVLAVPVLAVLTAQFALRRTIIEPLGVVRFSKPVNRKLAWRFGVIGLGVVLLLWHGGGRAGSPVWSYSVAAGATLLLAGVPILLPLVIERAVARLRGGPTSWQLAIRRLQLDSGTSARVVGGVAIVLAGAIAVQSVLTAQMDRFVDPSPTASAADPESAGMRVYPQEDVVGRAVELLDGVAGVQGAFRSELVNFQTGENGIMGFPLLDCTVLTEVYRVVDCEGGQVYTIGNFTTSEELAAGRTLQVTGLDRDGNYRSLATWTVPEARHVTPPAGLSPRFHGVVISAGGTLPNPMPLPFKRAVEVMLDPTDPDAPDRVRTALAPLGWKVYGNYFGSYGQYGNHSSVEEQSFLTIRRGLLIGAVFVLLVAGISLLVLALEHIRERRRPLAVLAASGVPTGALARSLLWQIAVPIALGALIAIGTGIALAALVLRLGNDPLYVDWPSVGLMTLAAAVLGLLVSVVTLPFLRGATRLTSLRTE